MALAAALVGSTASAGSPPAPLCTHVHASTSGGNGMTGGTLSWAVVVRNVDSRACTVEGIPLIRVPPTRFPVTVIELSRRSFGGGLGRPVRLEPRQTATAFLLMERPCAGSRRELVPDGVTVRVGYADSTIAVSGEACRREGAVVNVGPLRR